MLSIFPLKKPFFIFPLAHLTALGLNMFVLALIFYAQDVFRASTTETAVLAGTWSISYMVGCLSFTRWRHRILPRHCVLAASTVQCVLIFLLPRVPNYYFCFVLVVLVGLATSFFWPSLMGWLSANTEGEELNRKMGIFNFCWSSAVIYSPLLGGWLSERGTALPIFLSAAILGGSVLVGLGAVFFLETQSQDDSAHHLEKRTKSHADMGSPLRYPSWVGLFCLFFVSGILINLFPMILRHDFSLPKSRVGFILFVRAGTNFLGLVLFGKLSCWHHRGGQLVTGSLLTALLLLLYGMTRSIPVLILLQIFAGFCIAHAYANSLFHGVVGSIRRTSRMAIHEALLAAGLFLGSIVGGWVYEVFGAASMYMLTAALMLACAATQAILIRRYGCQLKAATV